MACFAWRLGRILCMLSLCGVALAAAPTSQNSDDWKAPERAARRKNPLPSDTETIAVGRDLYAHQCAACHGDKGRGDGKSAANLETRPRDLTTARVREQTDGALFWKIGEGHRPMPGFRQIVSEDARWHVVVYLRTFAAATATTQPATQAATSQP